MSKNDSLKNAEAIGLTLKNIKTFEGHDTMQGFNADVYVNGKKVFHAFDSAHGGCFEFTPADSKTKYNEVHGIVDELEDKLKKRPKYEIKWSKDKTSMFQDNLECVIGALVSDFLFQKDLKRDQKKGLLLEVNNGYSIIKYKAGTIANMLKKYGEAQVVPIVQKTYDQEVAKGEKILNVDYLKSIGVKV